MEPKEQKAQQAFGLSNSRDMLEKLKWELDNLFCRQRHDVRVCQYHAFNCAVTAWHITDWLWHDLPQDCKSDLHLNAFKDFQDYVRRECPSLNLCRQIANGSKHCHLHKPDPAISAVVSDGEGYEYGNPIIINGDVQHQANEVFHAALNWFESFMHDRSILPEEPFVSHGD